VRNNKGFTLVEMLIVVAIIGILTAVGIPSLTGQLDRAKAVACEANRVIFMRSYKMNMVFETGDYTLEQAINGDYPAMLQDLAGLTCPSGGTFSVVDGEIVCSVHGAIGSGETGGSGGGTGGDTDTLVAGDVIFGNITLGSWEDLCSDTKDLPWGGTDVVAGTVFIYGENVYVAKWDGYLPESEVDIGGTLFVPDPATKTYLLQFDPTTEVLTAANHNSDNSWTPPLTQGAICYDGGEHFVFYGTNINDALPSTGDGAWVMLIH